MKVLVSDQLNLNIDVAFSDTSSWDQAGFATIRQSTVLSNDLSGTIKSGYQPDNEEDYLTQYHDSSRVVTGEIELIKSIIHSKYMNTGKLVTEKTQKWYLFRFCPTPAYWMHIN